MFSASTKSQNYVSISRSLINSSEINAGQENNHEKYKYKMHLISIIRRTLNLDNINKLRLVNPYIFKDTNNTVNKVA